MKAKTAYEEFFSRFTLLAGVASPIRGGQVAKIVETENPAMMMNKVDGKYWLCDNVHWLRISPTCGINEMEEFCWPFEGGNNITTLTLTGPLTLKDMTLLPKSVQWLSLSGVTVESLKGIEDLPSLTSILLADDFRSSEFNCGLLRLLKSPSLSTIKFLSTSKTKTGLWAALSGVPAWFEDKDILAFQNALVDAGLDHYAKL